MADTIPILTHLDESGDVLTIAQIAGIMGVKATSTLIPLCHTQSLSGCTADITIKGDNAIIDCEVRCTGRTDVEIEVLTGALGSTQTIYDMRTALTHDMRGRRRPVDEQRGGKRDFGTGMPVIVVP